MIKNVLKRTLSLLMVVLTLAAFIPQIVWAANVNTGVAGLTADSSGNATWSSSGGTITGSVSAKVDSGCLGDSYTAQTGTLTLKNTSGSKATLLFSVTAETNDGVIQINGNNAGSREYSFALAADETVSVYIKSCDSAEKTTKITLSNIQLISEKNVNITFVPSENGSYTVDGTAINNSKTITKKSTESFSLVATPASGYSFAGWIVNNDPSNVISSETPASLVFTEDQTVSAYFVDSTVAVFDVAGKQFYNLNSAVSYAQSNNKSKITLVTNGTISAGNYTIPSGITLLIPFDEAQTVYTATPAVVYGSHTNPTAYRTLTMAPGTNITVQSGGAICCSGKLSSSGQMGGWNGTPTGPDGRIHMMGGSNITLESGANLYCWGYIYGDGAVEAKSGSTVYEAFQIKDWRGGTATLNVYDYAFIFSQYYIQNIEVPLTLYAGATEKLYSAANAGGSAYPMGATFVGSGGMFNISSGYMVKDYIESTDRMQLDVYGDATLTPMSLTGLPMIGSVSTENYVLPVTNNFSINIHNGTTTVTQNIKLLPSAEVTVDQGASLEIDSGKKVYVYDNDDWRNFTGNARLYPVGYSVANGTNVKRTAADLVDAKINVNGIVNVNGGLYTSQGGAAIVSDGGGKIILTKKPTSSTTIYEMANNKDKTAVSFTAAKLQNADKSYFETADQEAGSEIPYVNGVWNGMSSHHEHTYGNPIYTWAEDNVSCTASVTCSDVSCDHSDGETITETVQTTAEKTDPDCETNGNIVYTAVFENAVFSTQTKTITIPAAGHVPGTAIKENEISATCTAKGSYEAVTYCTVCNTELSRETVQTDALGHDLVHHDGKDPTCDEAGWNAYDTCTRCDYSTYAEIAAFGHDWGEPVYTWASDNSTVKAVHVCNRDHSHIEEETVKVNKTITPATCETNGQIQYTATFENPSFTTQTKTEVLTATGHTESEPVRENEVNPDCENGGGYDEVVYCKTCHKELSRSHTALNPLGHDWDVPTYEWASDNSSVTATHICKNDSAHEETETVQTTSEVTKSATCESKGETTYTATFTNNAFETQTKTVANIDALGHDWYAPTYAWSADNSEVKASRICKHNAAHVETETVSTSYSVTTAATCETDGEGTYTATFENEAFTTQTKTVLIYATGHRWGTPVYSWAEDNGTVTAVIICKNDATHTVRETVNTTSEVTKPATCEAKGETTYTATFANPAFTKQTKTVANINALGHDWEYVDFTWIGNDEAGYTAAQVNFRCRNDSGHTLSKDATLTTSTEDATCTQAGKVTYTAVLAAEESPDGVEHQDTKIVTSVALGHDWDDPTYTWAEDNSSVTATRICNHDAFHVETETVDTTSEVTKSATCEAKGETTYTATFTNSAFATQTKTVDNVPALGHDWNDPTYTWSADNSEVTASRICKH
ncbi:MAG: hypothetical protein II143_00145, partial [Bacteroidales bacterium]|nr:hypothetical protein [Bacteroidales bacterium]